MAGKRDLSIPTALGGVMLVALAGAGSLAIYMDRRNEKALELLCSEKGGLHYVSKADGSDVYETTPHMLTDEDLKKTGGISWRETRDFMHAYLKLQKQGDGKYGRAEFEVIGEPYLSSDITERMSRLECYSHILAKIKNADYVEKAMRNRDASYRHQRGRSK